MANEYLDRVTVDDKTYDIRDRGAMRNTEGSVSTAYIEDGAVTTDKIAAGAITADKIAAGAVVTNVDTEAIQDLAVTTAKIADGAVTADKLAEDVTDLIDGRIDAQLGEVINVAY